ncbi:methionine aminopeptidase 1D, mitochondrial [Daktulosphaira vitifoliae]|uniref:methionine aminopeptidase 1D, mitochondrial n=1 Tax=Daktulosphaira vitifoliae TaxID=58002 RepID=UPI0021A9C40F|nr:methionine aminopeptidase 1D, mitochondrial [Daktulosphaira vitifoliae]
MTLFIHTLRHYFYNNLCTRLFWWRTKQSHGVYDIVSLGNISPPRIVPQYVTLPSYAETGEVFDEPDYNSPPEIKSGGQILMMRQSCKLAKFVLDSTRSLMKVGITTDEIDQFAHNLIIDNNAYPSPLNYKGFLKSICTSINNVVCHGIPDDRPLQNGDIISVDVSVYLNGFHGDCAATYCIGEVDKYGKKLLSIAEQCMYSGISVCEPGRSFSDIGKAIEMHAIKNDHRVVSCITGHGIGTYFHGPPTIFHTTLNKFSGVMKPGMIFTVEPVIVQGTENVEFLDDGWSIVTADDSRGAQFEHTILITDTGYEILTL